MRKPPLESADQLIAQGNQAEHAGDLGLATERYRDALRIAPGYARAHLNLGIALEAMGDAPGAIASHRAALANDAAEPFAGYNLGRLLYLQGDLGEAERWLREALRIRPGFPEAHVVLAALLRTQGKDAPARVELETALRQRPDYYEAKHALAELHARLSNAHAERGDLAGAARELEALLVLRPEWADALYNYGCVLKRLMRSADAEAAFRRVLAVDPGHGPACRMLGGVLREQCQTDAALELYRGARQHRPEDFELASAELYTLIGSDRITEDALFAAHAALGAAIERAHPPRFEPLANPRQPERRLRIGYLSADFRYHVVTLFMQPVLERRDRSAFEVYCYSTADSADEYTRRLAAQADVWRECAGASAAQIAERVNADRIDILVDLAGHSGSPQLRVFAQRPAPVQATWLGYLATTGLSRMHYRITDPIADPPGLTERHHSEVLVRLPHSQWCYRPFIQADAAPTPPCERNGFITFGSFNQAAKISPGTRRLWAELLARLPGARLLVAGIPPGRAQDDLRRDLAQAGVTGERLSIRPYVSVQDYFRLFDAVDIALDTLPYSGGTTTCDALWMGVPVITLAGARSTSRSAASLLTTVGLPEWIASSAQDYVGKTLAFAAERHRLARLRASLRQRMRASPLMDEAAFARDLEAAYRQMWRDWCAEGALKA
jgi:predicted O-linked N-acetylglucosamine transferase (SPINDLY family)